MNNKNFMEFYVICNVSRSGMSAKYKIFYIDENGELINICRHTNKGKSYNYQTVHGCGFDRIDFIIDHWKEKNNITKSHKYMIIDDFIECEI